MEDNRQKWRNISSRCCLALDFRSPCLSLKRIPFLTCTKEFVMKTFVRNSFTNSLLRSCFASVLLFVPLSSYAQTFFGSGGTTNSATNENNLGFGFRSLFSNTSGFENTAIGSQSLYSNTTGFQNTALGYSLLDTTQPAWIT